MAVNSFRRCLSVLKQPMRFEHWIKPCRYISSSHVCWQDEHYVDVTKQDDVIVGMKQLRRLMQVHVGGKKDWLEDTSRTKMETVTSQDELVHRCMADSVQEVIIPLGTDTKLGEEYLNFYGEVRIGKLLQDFDSLSVWSGFRYYKGHSGRPPFSLVTAFVDSIDFTGVSNTHSLNPKQDLKLTGFVSWVGKTSLEVTIVISQQEASGQWMKKAESVFIMAARSVNDGSSAVLNKMTPQNETEKWYFDRGEANKAARKNQLSQSLFKMAPTAEERELIHDTFLSTIDSSKSSFQSRIKPENTVWMKESGLKTLVICHPESRNIYNKIFGGYLMKEAFELAWANACIYMKASPILTSVEDIIFRRPVEIGSLLHFSSVVVYTNDKLVQTRVVAETYDPKAGTYDATNIFYFCFSCDNSFPQVIPKTYGEYILYLDGRRICYQTE